MTEEKYQIDSIRGIYTGEKVEAVYYNEYHKGIKRFHEEGIVHEINDMRHHNIAPREEYHVVLSQSGRPRVGIDKVVSVQCNCADSKLYSHSRGWLCPSCDDI